MKRRLFWFYLLWGAAVAACSASPINDSGGAQPRPDDEGDRIGLQIREARVERTLVNPETVAAAAATWLDDAAPVIGVEQGGEARAYPLAQAVAHEIINDTLGGRPILVTYCNLCRSGITFDPIVDGELYIFDVIGYYERVLAMRDRQTESIWTQLDGSVLTGPLAESSPQLTLLPMNLVTWADWRARYPATSVLKPVDAFLDLYGSIGDRLDQTNIESAPDESGLAPEAIVVGVNSNAQYRAYPMALFPTGISVLHDTIGDRNIVLFIAKGADEANSGNAFAAELAGQPLTFIAAGGVIRDNRGNEWNLNGQAVSGPDSGAQLSFIPSFACRWYGWSTYHRETTIYQP